MSQILAQVTDIESYKTLHIVKFRCGDEVLSMTSLELGGDVSVGSRVKLIIKPTHIAIAKEFVGEISHSNQIKSIIKSINNGRLLSAIKLQFQDTVLESIITLSSSQKMELKVGDNIIALIKANEISIGEVL